MSLDDKIRNAMLASRKAKKAIDQGEIPPEYLKLQQDEKMSDEEMCQFMKFSYAIGSGAIKITREKNLAQGEQGVLFDFGPRKN